jgi:hypothetical protein
MATPPIPTVTITVQDQGSQAALAVPLSTIQLKIGVCPGATTNVPLATSSPSYLQLNLGAGCGPLVEAGGLVCQQGNVVVAVPCPIVTKGSAYAVQATTPNGSSSTITTTLDTTYGCYDTYFVVMQVTVSGTIGSAPGPTVQFSGDAGRNFGPPISLGTSNTLYLGSGVYNTPAPGGTGIQMNFGAGTLKVGDVWKFGTVGPQANSAGIVSALSAFQASQYGVAGVGSIHIVGDTMHGGSTDTDIAGIQTQLQAGTAIYEYQRAIVELRDTLAPTAYGGTGETEAVWIAALQTAVSALTAEPRICADGGHYNMVSAYANASFGLPEYRRNLAWAHSVIRTQIKLEQRAGRVKNANQPYQQIDVNPASDPSDGFVYHDERIVPGLASARISCAMTWPKKGAGFFHCTEPLLCAPGSQQAELVLGNVLDAACNIAYAQGVQSVSDDLLLQANGTLDPVALNLLQGNIQQSLTQGLTAPGYVSLVTATVSPTANVLATGIIPVTVAVTPKGYVNALQETVFLSNGGL